MVDVLKYLTKRVIDLENDQKHIINSNFGLSQEIKKLENIKDTLKYVYSELKSYDCYIPEVVKNELIKYIEEHVGDLDENIN